MPITGEAKKAANKAAYEREKQLRNLITEAEQKDVTLKGVRFLSESLSYTDLTKIYLGQPYKEIEEDEEESSYKKYKDKKLKLPDPSRSEILGEKFTFEQWLELRDKARKNLYWLGKVVLKKDFEPNTHQIVCDQFVQKNFDGAFPAGYTIGDVHKAINRQQRYDSKGNETKEALILDPRGFFKSSIDGIDCIQWMLNVPDIRILILTGEYKLAVAFMKEIKGYLRMRKGEDPNDLHLLFPEYVLRGVTAESKEPFTVPCRVHNQKEATLWVNSIEGNLSGWHCDVKKSDDVITDENSNTTDAREELKKKFDGTGNLIDEWGFSDNIGTRYFGDPDPDWYGARLKEAAESSDAAIKYFVRKCWEVRPEFVEVPLRELTEDMVILNFPEKATFKSLRAKLLKDEIAFRCQQLNEPAASDKDAGYKITFDEDVLRKHLYQREAAPKVGEVFICWDWALTANKKSDYSAGIAARVYQREDGQYGLVILEVAFGKWTSSELCLQIIQFNKKWNPKKTLIEKSTGAEWLQKDLQRQAPLYGVTLDIYWKPPSLQEHAKRNRIKGLETLLVDDRLWFVIGNWIDETFYQLHEYTGEKKNKGRKDDIPDAMSYLHIFLPSILPGLAETQESKDLILAQKKLAELKASYDRIFGTAPNAPVSDFNETDEDGGYWKPKWPTK